MFYKNNKRKKAFTLAEVLITLSIIGVIAAMTIPTLVLNYQRNITETRMKAFYSNMTQAVGQWLAEEHMEPKDVYFQNMGSSDNFVTWWNNNIGKHLTVSNVEAIAKVGEFPAIRLTMLDGSAANVYINNPNNKSATMHFFWYAERRFCPERFENAVDGRRAFLFTLHNGNYSNENLPNKGENYKGRFITSMASTQAQSRETLLQDCGGSLANGRYGCTRLIEVDGWKIKSDYPWF